MDNNNLEQPIQLYSKIKDALKSKQYETVTQQLKNDQNYYHEQLLLMMIDYYNQCIDINEDDMEQWLCLITSIIKQPNHIIITKSFVSQVIEQIIAITSHKYSLVIIKSIIQQLQSNNKGKLVIELHLYLFVQLLFDATIQDLIQLYKECSNLYLSVYNQINQNQNNSNLPQQHHHLLKQMYIQMLNKSITKIIQNQYKINNKSLLKSLQLIENIIKTLYSFFIKVNNSQDVILQQKKQLLQLSFTQQRLYFSIPLQIINKFNINILQMQNPSIMFTYPILSYYKRDIMFKSNIFHDQLVNLIIIKVINHELKDQLTAPPDFNAFQTQFINKSIQHLSNAFRTYPPQQYNFIYQHFDQISILIQKINIYLGCLDTKSPLYGLIMQTFVTLPFLNQHSKQRFLSKLILKHTNASFKTHLITQYRSLINYKCDIKIWIKAKYILFKQLKTLNTLNLDYLGHMVSFAFYWKSLLTKFIKMNNSNNLSIHFEIDKIIDQFNNIFINIKKQLQLKINPLLSQNQNQNRNQVQINQINVCIFRIDDLLLKPMDCLK